MMQPGPARAFRTAVRFICRVYLVWVHRIRYKGLENVPAQGPVVLAGHSYGGSVMSDAAATTTSLRFPVWSASQPHTLGATMRITGCMDIRMAISMALKWMDWRYRLQ